MTEMAISLLVGLVAAGFVWYTWGLLENLLALLGLKGKATGGAGKGRSDEFEL